jgi:hypothetical protein
MRNPALALSAYDSSLLVEVFDIPLHITSLSSVACSKSGCALPRYRLNTPPNVSGNNIRKIRIRHWIMSTSPPFRKVKFILEHLNRLVRVVR